MKTVLAAGVMLLGRPFLGRALLPSMAVAFARSICMIRLYFASSPVSPSRSMTRKLMVIESQDFIEAIVHIVELVDVFPGLASVRVQLYDAAILPERLSFFSAGRVLQERALEDAVGKLAVRRQG